MTVSGAKYPFRLAIFLACVALLAVLIAPGARAAEFRVVVVPQLDLEAVANRGAVGLLVPGAGPETSRQQAQAALVRGEIRNSLLGGLPAGRPLIAIETSTALPEPPAIVLQLPPREAGLNDRRYPIAVLGEGYRGILISARTRLPGLVSIVDVAPTALGRNDGLTSRPRRDAAGELARLDRRIEANGDARIPVLMLVAALVLGLVLVAPAAAVWGLSTALVANLALGVAGATQLWVVLLAAGVAVVGGGLLLSRLLRGQAARGLALAAVLVLYLVVPAVDTDSLALSPLGPTQNARFYGLSNLLETLLLVPALAGAALLGAHFGPLGFATAAIPALVAVGSSRLGADGGGAIVFAVGLGVLALGIWRRRALLPLAIAGVVVSAYLAFDAVTGTSHLADAVKGGIGDDVIRRIELSYARAVSGWGVGLLVAVGIAALAAAAAVELGGRRRPVLGAFLVAIAVSLVLNDSPNDVVTAGLLGYLTLAAACGSRFLIPRRWRERSPSSSPERRERTSRVVAS
jgi:hypothetical protein